MKCSQSLRNAYRLIILSLCSALCACGGGGGGENTSLSVPVVSATPSPVLPPLIPPAAGNKLMGTLLINEISTDYYAKSGAWLEIYNSGQQDINLDGFVLRTSKNFGFEEEFALPNNLKIKAGGYLILAADHGRGVKNSEQIIYLRNLFAEPGWGQDGSVQLLKGAETIDFVRFGLSAVQPRTADAWQGKNVPNLPYSSTDYGRSLVRQGSANTHSAQDWVLVPFATPGAINDVPANAKDDDADGIPDSAEVAGGSFAGIDYYALGARVNTPDIFVQIDYMQSADPGITPRKEALQKVVDAFKARGIALHFDVGNLYSEAFRPDAFNLGGGAFRTQ